MLDIPLILSLFPNSFNKFNKNEHSSNKILYLYYRSGSERSGIVCVLMNEFERISLKQETNILETVKCMRETNPQLIPNYVRIKSITILPK